MHSTVREVAFTIVPRDYLASTSLKGRQVPSVVPACLQAPHPLRLCYTVRVTRPFPQVSTISTDVALVCLWTFVKASSQHAKTSQLDFLWETIGDGGEAEIYFESAAFRKLVHIPSRRRFQSHFIEKRRMQRVRNCSDLGQRALGELNGVGQQLSPGPG